MRWKLWDKRKTNNFTWLGLNLRWGEKELSGQRWKFTCQQYFMGLSYHKVERHLWKCHVHARLCLWKASDHCVKVDIFANFAFTAITRKFPHAKISKHHIDSIIWTQCIGSKKVSTSKNTVVQIIKMQKCPQAKIFHFNINTGAIHLLVSNYKLRGGD